MNILKKIILKIIYIHWCIKTTFYFALFGSHGVSNCIEIMPYPFIIKFLRKYGASIGESCNIERGLILHRPDPSKPFKNLKLGNNIYIGHKLLIDLTDEVHIKDYSAFGANIQIWTHTGDWTFDRTDENEKIEPVTIGKAVIVYSGVIIGQNVHIGDYARVGAGSVVTKNIPEKTFVAGIPAKEINKRKF